MTSITGELPPGGLDHLPGALPRGFQIPDDVDVSAAATSVLKNFADWGLEDFTADALWRDTYAVSGTIRTFYSNKLVAKKWELMTSSRNVHSAKVIEGSGKVTRPQKDLAWIECGFTFRTSRPDTECSAFLSLVPGESEGTWKIWMLRTILEQLSGQQNVDVLAPVTTTNGNGHIYGSADPEHFEVIIIGGGQAGLSTGGRLQALGISYVVLEKNKQAGDAWGKRYQSARLHTIRESAHMPFERTFAEGDGDYIGKDELAAGHKRWADKYGIKIWTSTTPELGHWDAETQTYKLEIRRNGTSKQITSRHVVFATGAGSETPIMPPYPGKEKYRGTVLHSSKYSTIEEWSGKCGIVVGTANTAHDVAEDMVAANMHATMVQRSRTYVLPKEYVAAAYKLIYNPHTPTELADRIQQTRVLSIARLMVSASFGAKARQEPERWEGLEKAGFKVDPYGDLIYALNVRLGGHYIDVGASAKIAKGLIKVKSDSPIAEYTEDGLRFQDGQEIKADVIVFATGFLGNIRDHVESLFGKDVADRAGNCFGVNDEGEVMGAFKPLKQPNMWYIGGAIGQGRFYSRFLALSIKAQAIGSPLPVYMDG